MEKLSIGKFTAREKLLLRAKEFVASLQELTNPVLEDAELEAGIAEQVANAKAILGETFHLSLQCRSTFTAEAVIISIWVLCKLRDGLWLRSQLFSSCVDLLQHRQLR